MSRFPRFTPILPGHRVIVNPSSQLVPLASGGYVMRRASSIVIEGIYEPKNEQEYEILARRAESGRLIREVDPALDGEDEGYPAEEPEEIEDIPAPAPVKAKLIDDILEGGAEEADEEPRVARDFSEIRTATAAAEVLTGNYGINPDLLKQNGRVSSQRVLDLAAQMGVQFPNLRAR
jgi:hypothetical protein